MEVVEVDDYLPSLRMLVKCHIEHPTGFLPIKLQIFGLIVLNGMNLLRVYHNWKLRLR